jgi:hypothetical protein
MPGLLTRGLGLGLGGPLVTRGLGGVAVVVPDDLIEALWLRWKLATPNSPAGGLWIDLAPPHASFPHAVLAEVSRVRDNELLEARGRQTLVLAGRCQIQAAARSRTEARSVARAIAADWALAVRDNSLVFTEGRLIDFRKSGLELSHLDPDPGPDGRDVWTHLIEFQYSIVEGP